MPDLQSELAKINNAIKDLAFDDEEEAKPKTGTEMIFEHIKAHPGSTAKDVEAAIGVECSSRILDLVKRGLCIRNRASEDDVWRYTAVAKEYRALSIEERLALARAAREANLAKPKPPKQPRVKIGAVDKDAERKERQREYNRMYREKMKALKEQATTHQPAAPRVVNSIDELVDSLSLKQARELYDKLRAIFGG